MHVLSSFFAGLRRDFRLEFMPPLMVYLAAGISGLTAIVGTFFVKESLGLSAEMLAALGFWAGIPWALKIPMGHLTDLLWRYKAWFVVLGATLIAASLAVMLGLLQSPDAMRAVTPLDSWYIFAALLAPVGYMMQDTVADAMTVEAVPSVNSDGQPLTPEAKRVLNTTMQTLGRIAIISGGVLVSFVNVMMFEGVDQNDSAALREVYVQIYQLAFLIPLVSLSGLALAAYLRRRRVRALVAAGWQLDAARASVYDNPEPIAANVWILGGSAVFVAITLAVGQSDLTYGQEIIFGGSLAVIGFLIWRLLRELSKEARATLLGTAIVIFVFRAIPTSGAGTTWWMIDELKFDQAFLARLSLLSSALTLFGLFYFRKLMAERSIAFIVIALSIAGFVLSLPLLGMYHGIHEWTAQLTGGVVDARFIALIDTALESPLGQISMVPLLTWIATSAPAHLKATFFAVMASFTNLALSASQLATKYLNQVFVVTREVVAADGGVTTPADYSQLGDLLLLCAALTLILPVLAIALTRACGLRSA